MRPFGWQAADQIAGFCRFLEKVEQDQFNRLGGPAAASQNLEELLPYAIAL